MAIVCSFDHVRHHAAWVALAARPAIVLTAPSSCQGICTVSIKIILYVKLQKPCKAMSEKRPLNKEQETIERD